MLRRFLLPVVVTALAVSGCSTSPVVKLYDGDKRPDSEIAVVRIPMELEVLKINGQRVGGMNKVFGPPYKDLHLEPGEYQMLIYYKDLWDINADAHDVIKSDPALFEIRAEAGHFYEVGFDEPQNLEQARALEKNFSGHITDVSDNETIPSKPSGVAFRSGLLGSLGELAGTGDTVEAKPEGSEDSGNTVIKPLRKEQPAKEAQTGETEVATAQSGEAGKTDKTESATTATGKTPAEPGTSADSGYLDMLKATWSQATPEERRQFLRWISEQK